MWKKQGKKVEVKEESQGNEHSCKYGGAYLGE